MVYMPFCRFEGKLKHREQKLLSMLSQNLGQCWKPLKSMTPLTWSVRSATRLVSNWLKVGSEVGFTPDMKIFKLVSGI